MVLMTTGTGRQVSRMGQLWALIQAHIDASPYPPSERQVASKLGIAPNALSNWKNLRRLPTPENLHNLAALIGVPYRVVLSAALTDTGYLEGAERYGTDRPAAMTNGASSAEDGAPQVFAESVGTRPLATVEEQDIGAKGGTVDPTIGPQLVGHGSARRKGKPRRRHTRSTDTSGEQS